MNRRELRDRLLKVLEKAQERRPELRGDKLIENEPAFVHYERHQLFNAVLQERQKLNKPPIQLSEIKRVETMACGHSDYSSKFALYCAELVLDI